MTLSRELLKTKVFWWVEIIDSIPIILGSLIMLTKSDLFILFIGYFGLGMFMLIVGIKELALMNNRVELIPKNYRQWSSVVKSRDSNKCVYCFETEQLDAHHLAPKSIFPKLKLNINNGITVCKRDHWIAADIFRRLQMVCKIEAK